MNLELKKGKNFFLNVVLVILAFFYISYGLNWGLPSSERINSLFKNKQNLINQSDDLVKTYNQEKKKTNNEIYIKNYVEYKANQSYETSISLALSRFLIVPYAGDDAFILKALRNLDPEKLDFDPNYYMYGGGFVYSAAVLLKFLDIISVIKLENDISFYLLNPNEIGKIYLYLRYFVAFSFLVGLIIFFNFTKKVLGKKYAYLSSFILLINPEIIASTHAIEPHAFVFPIFMLALFFAKRYYDYIDDKNLLLYGIFTGLSVGTQATSLYLIFPFFYIQYINYKNHLKFNNIFNNSIKFLFFSFIPFLLINPYYILNFSGMINNLFVGFDNLFSFKESNSNIFQRFWAPFQISLVLTMLSVFSIFFSFFFITNKYKNLFISLLVPAIMIYLILGGIMQYIFGSLAIFSILISLMIFDLSSKLKVSLRNFLILIISILFLISPINRSIYYLINYNYDNRMLSAIWINENIDKNKKISLRFPPTNWDSIPFNFLNFDILDKENILKSDYVILVNEFLDEKFSDQFLLIKKFPPKSIFGYRPELKGEVSAIYAKYINIYKKK